MTGQRPKIIEAPVDPTRRQPLQRKLDELHASLPDGVVSSFSEVGVACQIVVLGMALEYGRIDTGQVYEALVDANPDLKTILEAEP